MSRCLTRTAGWRTTPRPRSPNGSLRRTRSRAAGSTRCRRAPRSRERIGKLLRSEPVARYGFQYRKQLFALKRQPPRAQPHARRVEADGVVSSERTVLDPVALDPSGRTTIDFYRPSHDGRHVVVSLSKDGSEDGTAHVFDVATGKRLPDVVPGVTFPTAGGSVEWAPDSRGLLLHALSARQRAARRRPSFLSAGLVSRAGHADGERSIRDRPGLSADRGDRASRQPATAATCSPSVANGDGGEFAYHLRDAGRPLDRDRGLQATRVKRVVFGDDGNLYATHGEGRAARPHRRDPAGATRARERAPSSFPRRHGAGRERHRDAHAALRHVSNRRAVHGAHLRARRQAAWRQLPAPTRFGHRTSSTAARRRRRPRAHDELRRPAFAGRVTTARRNRLVRTQLIGKPDRSISRTPSSRASSPMSKDGTRVPLNVVQRKGAPRDGSQPAAAVRLRRLRHQHGRPISRRCTRLWLD